MADSCAPPSFRLRSPIKQQSPAPFQSRASDFLLAEQSVAYPNDLLEQSRIFLKIILESFTH
jgi:hypothetical protein